MKEFEALRERAAVRGGAFDYVVAAVLQSPLVSYDLETWDPDLKKLGPGWAFPDYRGFITGYAFAVRTADRTVSLYLPVRHLQGSNCPEPVVKEFVHRIVDDPRRITVAANALYDYGWTRSEGFPFKARMEDTQVLAPLLDDQRSSYSLDNLAKHYLGQSKSSVALKARAKEFGMDDPMANMHRLPSSVVAPYALDDAEVNLELYNHLRPMIDAPDSDGRNLVEVYELETQLMPVLYEIRRRGVRVDLKKTEENREVFLKREKEYMNQIIHIHGKEVDIWSSGSMVSALKQQGVSDFPLTPKKKVESVSNDLLKNLSMNDNPAGRLAAALAGIRRIQKARSTFLDGMILEHAVNGRIHCELMPLKTDDGGTVSGRFSCRNPNLQQVPARDEEIGPLVRSSFLPDEGELWGSIDYASQEPRLALHFAHLLGLPGAAEQVQMFIDDPRTDPYLPTAEICGISRKFAKTIKLGILYGMGGGKLCYSLGLPTESRVWKGKQISVPGMEGEKILENYHRASPLDKKLSEVARKVATSRGYVRTILGRKTSFPKQEDGSVWFVHKALNRIIQGSAADMMKKAILDCHRAGITPILSIHDENCFSEPEAANIEEASRIMSNVFELSLPFVCDVAIGENWGASMDD